MRDTTHVPCHRIDSHAEDILWPFREELPPEVRSLLCKSKRPPTAIVQFWPIFADVHEGAAENRIDSTFTFSLAIPR